MISAWEGTIVHFVRKNIKNTSNTPFISETLLKKLIVSNHSKWSQNLLTELKDKPQSNLNTRNCNAII